MDDKTEDASAVDDQSPRAKHGQESAGSALELLRSLAVAEASADNLERAFLDWARLSADALSHPEFEHILSTFVSPASDPERNSETASQTQPSSTQRYDLSDVFFLDANGIVSDISSELSDLLQLKAGDSVEPGLFQELFEEAQSIGSAQSLPATIELKDKFQLKRRLVIHQVDQRQGRLSYAAVFIRITLSENASDVLREKYGLTRSELEILELAVQHYSPEHIAQIRSSKLNTVRTHISRLIQKMGSRSLGEAIGFAIELSLATEADALTFFGARQQRGDATRKVTIPDQDAVVEYARYGPVSGTPVIVLHSLEYGYEPTTAFVEAARERNICLYFPRRPGFGGTTPVRNLSDAASLMGGFIKALDLSRAAVVGLSTAAPIAVAIENADDRIEQLVLVNYGLNADSKVDVIEPAWIRGMIKMALAAPSSFSVGIGVVRSFLRTVGSERFYRLLYSAIEADTAFLEAHPEVFGRSAELISKADKSSVRLDIMSSFLSNRDLPHQLARQRSVVVANGDHQHNVKPEQAQESAASLSVELVIIPNGGRNWPFVQPGRLFDLIFQDPANA